MIHVLFVCLGNICRSPMAEAVFRHLVEQAGLAGRVEVSSAGTGDWHVGESAHPGTRAVLQRRGIACLGCARLVSPADLEAADYVVAMDHANVAALRRLDRRGQLDGKLSTLMQFAPPGAPAEVPDPYFTGDFDGVYELVEAGCRGLLAHVRRQHGL